MRKRATGAIFRLGTSFTRTKTEHSCFNPSIWTRGGRPDPAIRPSLAFVRAFGAGPLRTPVSSTGTLAYATGTELEHRLLVEVDLTGRELRRFGPPRSFDYLQLSTDGRTLAMTIRSAKQDDIYLMDVESGRFDRFTFEITEDESPVWSPDGRQIAYSSAWVGEQRRIFVKTVGSAERERLVYAGRYHLHLSSWAPDGRWLAFYEFHPRLGREIRLLDLEDTSQLVSVAATAALECCAVFSPDGRWLAYHSEETGRFEVYVVSVPGLGAKQQVSREGGMLPRWSASGQELFFLQPSPGSSRMMMAHRVGGAGSTAWQDSVSLFERSRPRDLCCRKLAPGSHIRALGDTLAICTDLFRYRPSRSQETVQPSGNGERFA